MAGARTARPVIKRRFCDIVSIFMTCQKCSGNFEIDNNDRAFYERLGVGEPTFCPDCRHRRRLFFRNERALYKRKCDVTGKDIISIYHPDTPYKVCNKDFWYTDEFDATSYGRDIDWSRPFLEQFHELLLDVPLPSLRVEISKNCEYNADMSESVDCYLCARTHRCERMLYTYRGNASTDCVDCFQVIDKSDFLYECTECITCSRSQYLYTCEQCVDSMFLYNCRNCMNCFMCSNLRNKSYCFMNKQYSKEDYEHLLSELHLERRENRQALLARFEEFLLETPRKYLNIQNAPGCTGDNIVDSSRCLDSFGIKNCESSRYLLDNQKYRDSMDSYSGGKNSELVYEVTSVSASSRVVACLRSSFSHDVYYAWFVSNVANVFGCIGLDKKEYCILNKQYTKEEYEEIFPRLIAHMNDMPFTDIDGTIYRYGEFFPESFSPYAYNETTAQEYFPLTPETVSQHGYFWRDPEEKKYVPTLSYKDIPQTISLVGDGITSEVIACEDEGTCSHGCTKAYRVTAQELEWYRRMNIPVPTKCPNCRYHRRVAYRNPIHLWHRTCQCAGNSSDNGLYTNTTPHEHGTGHCVVTFDTSYDSDRKEIIYCDECYKKEVL